MRVFLISILLFSFCAKGQLVFEEGNLATVFEKAKIENKPVFMFIYLDGCSHCDAFKETFKTMTTGAEYYHQNFINGKVELNSEDGKAIRFKWGLNVLSTPLFTFWSPDSSLLSLQPSTDILNKPSAILQMAKDALDPETSWEKEKSTYSKETDLGKLAQLAYKARFVQDTVTNMAALDRYVEVKGLKNLSSNDFILIKQAVTSMESPLFTYLMNNKKTLADRYGEKEVYGTIENIVMFSLMSSRSQTYDDTKIDFMKMALLSIGRPEQTVKARFLLFETNRFFASGENEKAYALLEDYYQGATTIHPNEAAFVRKHLKEKTGKAELPPGLKKLIDEKTQKKL